MARNWEEQLRAWAKPPSDAEIERCEAAIINVKAAISQNAKLQRVNPRVILQGSYRNNTNVKRDSDVDIGVICLVPFYTVYPPGYSGRDFGNEAADYTFAEFKNDIGAALEGYFRKGTVSRGNKAFNVRESDRRVEADVAAFLEHRHYNIDGRYASGVELRADNDPKLRVVNWPEQHYDNGVAKNQDTRTRYKALVRSLKNIRNELIDTTQIDGRTITGFLCECLLWNVPSYHFSSESYQASMRAVLAFLYDAISENAKCADWREVNNIKLLFSTSQKWTRQQAHDFVLQAWRQIGFV